MHNQTKKEKLLNESVWLKRMIALDRNLQNENNQEERIYTIWRMLNTSRAFRYQWIATAAIQKTWKYFND